MAARELRIIDSHFDVDFGVKTLMTILGQSNLAEIRLLTAHVENRRRWQDDMETQLASRKLKGRPVAAQVLWKDTLRSKEASDVHDRFAIVDDELWHFGATVGGANRSVNAYSRGWDATATRALDFFAEVWGPC